MTKDQFREIFEDNFDAVRNYIYYRSGDQELATDIAQETFMKVWEKQFKLKSDKIKPLLFKIAGDAFVSSYRKRQTEINFQLSLKNNETFESPESKIEFEELKHTYENSLKSLPEKQRTVFLMSRLDGMKYNEIADNLGIGIKAVEKRMKLALAHIKLKLNR